MVVRNRRSLFQRVSCSPNPQCVWNIIVGKQAVESMHFCVEWEIIF